MRDYTKRFAKYLVDSSYSEAFFGTIKVEDRVSNPTPYQDLLTRYAMAEFLNDKKVESERKIIVLPRTEALRTISSSDYSSASAGHIDNDMQSMSVTAEDLLLKMLSNLKIKTRSDLEERRARGFKSFLPDYKGEMRPAVCAILLNVVTASSLCLLSIAVGLQDLSAILNLPSASSVLCNPLLNAAGSLVAGYLLDRLVIHPLVEKYAIYKINSVLEESYRDLNFATEFRGI